MIGQWKSYLEERSADWNLPAKGNWTFLFFNNYQPQESNIDLLWFHNGSKFPRVVTKCCREDRIVRREFENLVRAHACASAWAPRPLDFRRQGAFWGLWIEGVPGSSLASQQPDAAVRRSLVEMLTSMHAALRNSQAQVSADRYRRMVVEPLESVAQFGKVASVRAGCEELRSRIPTEWIEQLPVIPQHGDLFPGNLLLDGDRWHVVDWECFGAIDLPFFDLLTLLVSLLSAQGDSPERWDPVLVKQAPVLIEGYARELRLCAADVSRLLPLSLANWFCLQWREGRTKFTSQMYQAIQHYFEHRDFWESVFLPR